MDSLDTGQQAAAPVVVVGCGPAGIAFARELRRRQPQRPITLFGAEGYAPYDRVKISSALAGELPWTALSAGAGLPDDAQTRTHYGTAVTAIDRAQRCIVDGRGQRHAYSVLVLATGSSAHRPQIAGIERAGVFTFRHLDDAQRLIARRVRSRRTVVLGGGLLGLEAARAMRRFHTGITVVEHAQRLMPRQLDDEAAALLRREVERLGIEVIAGDGVVAIDGREAVESLQLRSGRRLDCDTLIVATGIVPNVRLALAAQLSIGRGIKVDDQLRSADPQIFAIGECAEHRGLVYGLVAPCLEQAAVAAGAVAGEAVQYAGSLTATKLKVLGTAVFSAGQTPEQLPAGAARSICHRNRNDATYRQLLLQRGRLIGAMAVGDWPESALLLDAVQRGERIGLWRRWRFSRSGRLWSQAQGQSVTAWPDGTIVCNCAGVSRGTLGAAIRGGCATRLALAACTRASTVCGSCAPLLDELLGQRSPPVAAWGSRWLLALGVLAALAGLLLALLPGLPYATHWPLAGARWDRLWFDATLKQLSGFSLMGLAVAGLAVSLRKRWPRWRWGLFALWRNLHDLIGTLLLALLVAHTGGRAGHGLNAALSMVFVLLAIAGAAAGALIAVEHRLAPARAKRLRGQLGWLHILAFWPLPALLALHVLKTYYF